MALEGTGVRGVGAVGAVGGVGGGQGGCLASFKIEASICTGTYLLKSQTFKCAFTLLVLKCFLLYSSAKILVSVRCFFSLCNAKLELN